MPVLTGLYFDEAVMPELYATEIVDTGGDGQIKTLSAKDRVNHLINVLVYAILVSTSKYGGQNGQGRDRYDLQRNNIHSITRENVDNGLKFNGIPDGLIDRISRWLFERDS